MASIELSDAFERHEFLPTAVNWLGTWDPTVVYFQNDIVVSPLNTGSYILTGNSTSFRGGPDPSVNPTSWYPFGSATNTIQSVSVGAGLQLSGTNTNPVIANTGVIQLQMGVGFENVGTQEDPILNCTLLDQVLPGPGIDVIGIPSPVISNTGVVLLQSGAGITVDFQPVGVGNGQATITNTGVNDMDSGEGIAIAGGQIKDVQNFGLTDIIVGTGITNTGTSKVVELENGGVISIEAVNHSITISGGPSNFEIASNPPRITNVWKPDTTTAMTPNPVNNGEGTIAVTQTVGTLWESCLETGTPFNSGIFTLQIPFTFRLDYQTLGAGNQFRYTLFDSTTNSRFDKFINVYPIAAVGQFKFLLYKLGTIQIDLAALRATGFRKLTAIIINSGALSSIRLQDVGGPAYATFYPTTD